MEYSWSNPSWKRMEAKSKQEYYHSKLAIDIYNFHHGGSNGVRNNHTNGNFTPKRHNGVEIKLFSLVFIENRYQFYFLNSLGTLTEKKQFIEFNSNSCAIPRVDECHHNIANYVSYVLGIEEKRRNMEKELDNFLKDLSISLFLNLSLMCYEVSLVELEFFFESYLSHVSVYGDLCAISFGGDLFLVVSYTSTCLSSHAFLENSLLHSGFMFDPSCHDFGVMNNASIESIAIDF
ncbi:hypothetical protein M9H77_17598 [Catharanthus roseus]|uniref:Uncharacterized protein n=1 Tax=Catharanthus roseus TaxID=4058 RepID=A0ACC0B506_CATRO|nr:hypothetical protein M9H77_17598 [Catharanthus roseus]